ncbi:anaerobic sulfatase maturase [candidate division KSB1 bacterium]|nr:anaerobic sulfatase maturase [candidate division KSB1 bacterium]
MPYEPLTSVLVKPAGPDCNMACTYCFYYDKASLFPESLKHRMSESVLEEMIKQMMQQGAKQVSFGWQGGEPTLMGLPFYRKAVQLQQKYGNGQTVGNGLQTNGILIDNDWAKFLRDYHFLVGLSLDGPRHVHDHYRKMLGGAGSWSTVNDHLKMMLDNDVEVNALVVVNDYSVNFPEEIYTFHKESGLNFMQFIPCVENDPKNTESTASFSVPADRLGEFWCKLFDLWINDFEEGKPTTSIRYFDSLFYRYVDLDAPECTLLPSCGNYIVVEHNGDVYSCDFFVDPEWKLGNVMHEKLIDMLNSERQHEFGRMKANWPEECDDCKWLKYCYGGCTKDRIRDPADDTQNHFCEAYKTFLEYSHETFTRLAGQWKMEQEREARKYRIQQLIDSGEIRPNRNDPCPCGSGLKFKRCCGK